jgi:hypothetical protein
LQRRKSGRNTSAINPASEEQDSEAAVLLSTDVFPVMSVPTRDEESTNEFVSQILRKVEDMLSNIAAQIYSI